MVQRALEKKSTGFTPIWRQNPFDALRKDMREMWQGMTGGEAFELWPGVAPPLDLSEGDAELEVKVDLPGFRATDIDVQLHQNILTISGEKKEEREEKEKNFHRIERQTGHFTRSVSLPCPVDESKIDAQVRDGVLTIQLPKTNEAKSKKIRVEG